MVNIEYFKEFVVLAETKSYWEAAERLYLNQSSLSKHIKSMETALDVPLFERTTRKVELTEYGKILLPFAQSIVKNQFEYSTALLQYRQSRQNLLSLGALPSMSHYGITKLVSDFQKKYPGYFVRLTEGDSYQLLQSLYVKDTELIFCRDPLRDIRHSEAYAETLTRYPYMNDHLVALLPKSHPLSSRSRINLNELENEIFCFIKEDSFMYDLCRAACQEASFIPNILLDCHQLNNIFDMVARGGYVSLLMEKHVSSFLSERKDPIPVVAVDLAPQLNSSISLCQRKNSQLSKVAKLFLTFFQEQTEKAAQQST